MQDYEYRVSGGTWSSVGLADHLVLEDAAVGEGGVNISVRALNAKGYGSEHATANGNIDSTQPAINGNIYLVMVR